MKTKANHKITKRNFDYIVKEELEAVDWYNQRYAASQDEELKKILAHNRDEEIEHACMLLEWLRRNMDSWDEELRKYLFTQAPITELEEELEEAGKRNQSLEIGEMK